MVPVPYNQWVAVTASDTVDLPPWSQTGRLTDAIVVGASGVVAAVMQNGVVANITATAGFVVPVALRRVNSSNTTATGITALYAN